ncbi:sensor histidine kinase [Neolewinella agarilytica]|uniref:sensor histidine kinase n=1 Tax=Neolewinella agarilytica TaxID=478744 RepID=UPI002352DB20|nr:histidine kinase dimerization/phosphoacceptor domain -containing protein [Neolewinella agarilytica]
MSAIFTHRGLFHCSVILLLCTCGSASLFAQLNKDPLKIFRDSVHLRISTLENDSSILVEYITLAARHRNPDTARARAYLDTAAQMVNRNPNPFDIGGLEYERTRFLRRVNEAGKARASINKAIEAYAQIDSTKFLSQCYGVSAEMHLRAGEVDKSIEQYQKSIELARSINDPRQEATMLNSLGLLHRRVGNLDEALEYLVIAGEKAEELGESRVVASAINNRAIIHKTRREFPEALLLYKRAMELALAETPLDEMGVGYVHNNLSGVYKEMGQSERALVESRLAYDIFSRLGGPREQCAALIGMGVNLADLDRFQEAIPSYQKAITIGKDYNMFQVAALKGIAQAYKGLRQLDSTVHYLELEANLRQEIKEKERIKVLADMEGKYQTAEKQREIDKLEYEEKLSQARIQRQGWIIGLGLLALSIVSFLLYRVFQQRQRISEQRQQLSKSLKDKETLLKEIHHRVKNNLQMVSSLLSLQSRYVSDDTAVAALKMGNSRVRSMALIHQKLYMSDEVSTTVKAGEYLQKLLDELVGNLTPPGLALTTSTDLEDLELDIDTMIPMGLIANELVTNSLKYAFKDRQKGTISLSLKRLDGKITLHLSDDGIGTAKNPAEAPESFGYLLINSLSEQLEGELTVDGNDGMKVTLTVPD